ncbi:MAG: hypothetical protein R3B41_02325 [Candidatus Doudnabacteria bacterium]
MLNKDFIEKMKARLIEEQAKLQEDLAGLGEHTELGTELDENAQEVEVDMVNANTRAQMSKDLEKIEKALHKIEDGTYGTDDQGNQISEARLEAMPWADVAL